MYNDFHEKYNKELIDERDFIGRARNIMATIKLSIENLKHQIENPNKNFDNDDFDIDFIKPKFLTIEERFYKLDKLNKEMFFSIDLLDKYLKEQKKEKEKEQDLYEMDR